MTRESNNSVFAIVLAAGSSSRFGSAKQLAEFDGVALVRRAEQLATECCDSRSVLVTGHEWRAVAAACTPTTGFIIVNDEHSAGMGSSIAAGVRAVQHVAGAIIVVLADQPLITARHVNALVAAWGGDEQEIVATAYAGSVGVPALFASGCFDSLLELEGDEGARALINSGRFSVQEIGFEEAAIDVDTVEDLARLARSARN